MVVHFGPGWVAPSPSLSHCRLFLSAADEPDDEPDACNRDLLGLSRVSRKNLCLTTLASRGQCDHCGLGMGSVLSDPRVPEGLPPSLCTLVTPSSRRDIHNYVEYPLHSFCARSGPPPSVQFSPKLFRAHLSSRQILLPAGKDLLVRLMHLSQAVEARTLETLCSLSSRSLGLWKRRIISGNLGLRRRGMNYGGATLGCCVSSRRKKVTVGETGKEGDLLTRSGTRRTTSCQGGIGRVAGNQGVAEGGIGL